MQVVPIPSHVAVVGAGVSGARCAQALRRAGCTVQVVDKARGAGGRLATRRLSWTDGEGRERLARLDHGAPAFFAQGAAFQAFCAEAAQAGAMARWAPELAPGSRPLDDAGSAPLYRPQPDMPALCRHLLDGVPSTWSFPVDRLLHGPEGWQLEAAGQRLTESFDAVVLALPLAQAAPLLAPHRSNWAQRAALALMQPCWTLMGVSRRVAAAGTWELARPEGGPLATVIQQTRHDAPADETHWVAHARPAWSREHLEQSPDAVRAQLQEALQSWLGGPVDWLHAVVHRWRYAMPQANGHAPDSPFWWDPALGLGVCGDGFGGAHIDGVEAAWASAQALTNAMRETQQQPMQHASE